MKKAFSKCLSNSTAHGFPRIIISDNRFSQFLWLFLSLITLGAFLFHSWRLYQQLLQEQTVTNTYERGINLIRPDILVCPKLTFARDYINEPPEDESNFMQSVFNKIKKFNKMADEYIPYGDATYPLWNSVNISQIYNAFFYRINEFVYSAICDGTRLIPYKENFQFEFNLQHLGCWRITQKTCPLHKSLILYFYIHSYNADIPHPRNLLNSINDDPIYLYRYLENLENDIGDGAILYFLSPNETVHQITPRITLRSMSETEIYFRSSLIVRQTVSKNPCVTKPKTISYYNMLESDITKNKLYANDIDACLTAKVQREIYRQYDCVVANMLIPDDIELPLNYCFDIFKNKYRRLFNEVYRILDDTNLANRFLDECYITNNMCNFTKYSFTHSSVNWPLLNLVETSILPNFQKLFELNINLKFPGIREAYYVMLNDSSQFYKYRENMYKVIIRKGEYQSTLILESLVYGWKNIFSDIGGIMGFYMGASILTILQILDMLIDFIRETFTKKEDSPKTNNNVEM